MKPRGSGLAIVLIALLSCASPQLAGQKQNTAIRGLDGALYDPYKRATIEHTQRALRDRGLYAGPISGILDPSTMQAIYAFQKGSNHLQMCGVPTPRTRLMLEQGSHTDPN
jgi:hypothetical protein